METCEKPLLFALIIASCYSIALMCMLYTSNVGQLMQNLNGRISRGNRIYQLHLLLQWLFL